MISIIIPVYNTGKKLYQCMNSVLEQDYRDIEVIVVDDASTDKSLSILRKYANKDIRVKVIENYKNVGIEQSRRIGYAEAQGKYIMYIDHDDWLTNSHVLSKMCRIAEDTNADYVEIGVQRVLDRFGWLKNIWPRPYTGLIEQPKLFDEFYISCFGTPRLSLYIWGKLYRKEFLDMVEIRPIGRHYGEDVNYTMQLFPHLKRIYIMNEVGYSWCYGGTSCQYNSYIFEDLRYLYRIKKEQMKKYQYWKAKDGLLYELISIFRSEICMMIEFSGKSKKEIFDYIHIEIENPLYNDIMNTDKSSIFWTGQFGKAFISKDIELIYEICYKQIRKEHPKRMLKRFAARIIQSL